MGGVRRFNEILLEKKRGREKGNVWRKYSREFF